MSIIEAITDDELEKAAVDYKIQRNNTIKEDIIRILTQVNKEAKKAYARGQKSFFINFNTQYSSKLKLRENEPVFQNFRKHFLNNNSAIRNIKISKSGYQRGLTFYFSNPHVENTFTTRLLKPMSYLRSVFTNASSKQLSESGQTRVERAESLMRTLASQTTQIKDTVLLETMNGVRTRLEETAKLALDETRQNLSLAIGLKFGIYLNQIYTLTRAMSVFLEISNPSDDDTMTLKTVIENTDTFASDFRSSIETTRDDKARLELNVIATVQKLNRP